jgi:poly[(R)-3-hydroxyalkanoate] polymerase subunit PhaC
MRTLESRATAGAFDILRANDLIFSYVVSNWLMRLDQQAFDILAWNADSTRLPAAMHSFCLRCLYLRDELALGGMELAGRQLSLSEVKSDAPTWWAQSTTTLCLGIRHTRPPGCWAAGFSTSYPAVAISPTSSTRKARSPGTRQPAKLPQTPEWRASATRQSGSWWSDWTAWAQARAGGRVKPPAMGSSQYLATADAPGEYVRG